MEDVSYSELIYQEIASAIRKLERDFTGGVLPRYVLCLLPYSRAEGSVRRDMGQMWKQGLLVRIGGAGARRGYRTASAFEREAFKLTGDFPYGSEK